ARRLRRGDGRPAPRAGPRPRDLAGSLGAPAAPPPPPRARLEGARRGHLGSPRPAAPFHALEGDGVGRLRPRRAGRRELRPYRADDETASIDGLPPGEGAFLPCTFWFVDNLALQGRIDEARALFERLLALRNDLGLLAEEYDPELRRQLGNFPQAFTHVALVNTAYNLARAEQKDHPCALEQRRPVEQPTAVGY